jgi:hypothetical protein
MSLGGTPDNSWKMCAIIKAIREVANAAVTTHSTDYGFCLEAQKQIGDRTATISVGYDLFQINSIHDEWVAGIAQSEGQRIAYHFEEAQHRGEQ